MAYTLAMALALTDHRRLLQRLARQNQAAHARVAAFPGRLRAAARAAYADGMPVSGIAAALGCSRYYAHTLVHGRKGRPTRDAT